MTKHRNKILPYDPKLRNIARLLRKHGTLGEVLLWKKLQRKTFGCEFHRQVPISNYIVDFFCHERMLAIEIDGNSHDDPEAFTRDRQRQTELEALGVRFLRFRDERIRKNLHEVTETIRLWIEDDANENRQHPP